MSNKVKDIDQKNQTLLFQWYYQYKKFDPNNVKIDTAQRLKICKN